MFDEVIANRVRQDFVELFGKANRKENVKRFKRPRALVSECTRGLSQLDFPIIARSSFKQESNPFICLINTLQRIVIEFDDKIIYFIYRCKQICKIYN